MEKIVLRGRGAAKGVAHGKALVGRGLLCFSSDVDVMTGVIGDPASQLKGQSVAGKVLVFPMGKGSTGGPYGLYMLYKGGKSPRAIVNVEADPITVSAAVISHIPMVYKLDRDPLEIIETGDEVEVDGDRGTVTVTKRGTR